MTSISPANSTALLMLQHAGSRTPTPTPQSSIGDRLVAAANGASAGGGYGNRVQGKVAEALFDRTVPDVTGMKVHLIEKLGEKFGISVDDFASPSEFGAAIRNMIGQLKLRDDAAFVIAEIEKDLGLDKLGISLDTLVEAIIDPDGESDDKLEAALLRQSSAAAQSQQTSGARPAVRLLSDGTGLYGF